MLLVSLNRRGPQYWFAQHWHVYVNTLRPRQKWPHFADDIFNGIFFNENIWIPIKISLKFVPNGPINHIPALVQIMAWRRSGDKPLSEPMIVSLLTHICVSQWVNIYISQPFTHSVKCRISICVIRYQFRYSLYSNRFYENTHTIRENLKWHCFFKVAPIIFHCGYAVGNI